MAIIDQIQGPADTRKLTVEELVQLAGEVRAEIISAVSQTGGHLGSNLGTVELTVALHHVFSLPEDRIIWDVSHQTYVHKLLTGRRDRLNTLRTYGGLAGYAKRTESDCDPFGAGHASTSISAALGFAAARDLLGKKNKVIAVIGDGAMTGGLAFEAMNNAGSLKKNLIVILNDNTWSISKNVGAIPRYLTSILADEKFNKLRNEVWELTGRFKRRDRIRETIHHIEESIKGFLVPGMLFEKFGFKYFGPIDGHDLPLLVRTLKDIRSLNGPIMLHVATTKGKGYAPAEKDEYKFHGVGKFDKVTGRAQASSAMRPSYTQVFGRAMLEIAETNPKVVAITAAMSSGTGLDGFAQRFPERFFDVGIAEAHAACFAAGLAAEGIRPYLTVYSTFMQRAYDQVIHDMAIQKLPVVICMDRAGLVGNDGETHHGVFDVAYLSTIPNLTFAVPKDGNELRAMLHHTANHLPDGFVALRYPRDTVPEEMSEKVSNLDWGKWEWLTAPGDAVLLTFGAMVHEALSAVDILAQRGIHLSVINARFIKPFDLEMLSATAHRAQQIITLEEGQLRGGFGQAIAEYLYDHEYRGRFKALGLPDRFVTHGNRDQLLEEVGLDSKGIARAVEQLMRRPLKTGSFFKRLALRRNGSHRESAGDEHVSMTGTDAE